MGYHEAGQGERPELPHFPGAPGGYESGMQTSRRHAGANVNLLHDVVCGSRGSAPRRRGAIQRPLSRGNNPTSTVSLARSKTVSRQCGSSTAVPLRAGTLNTPWMCIGWRRYDSFVNRTLLHSP